MLIIGTDEAGYGPNFGPLVISASVWRVPEGTTAACLYDRLAGCVVTHGDCPDVRKAKIGLSPSSHAAPIAIADSKRLYQHGGGLGRLERAVLAALGVVGRRPRSWCEVWAALAPACRDEWRAEPTHDGFDRTLPIDLPVEALEVAIDQLGQGLRNAGVELVALSSRTVFAAEFNRRLAVEDSKGSMLSRLTLELVRSVLAACPLTPVEVICDKHGGRNFYAGLITDCLEVGLVSPQVESRERSVYRAVEGDRPIELTFSARAESYLPVALASMTSKYLRELGMMAFNRFWCNRVAGLTPTAGYPADAQRFRVAIAAAQSELGLADTVLWRAK